MYEFRLYVVGRTPKSVRIVEELARLLEDVLDGHYNLEVIDVIKNPELAQKDKIVATPALERVSPEPIIRVVGDLSDRKSVLAALGLSAR
jgi:circadian clock protein KaiB